MAELQDEEKWLYGDEDKEIVGKTEPVNPEESEKALDKKDTENENTVNGGDAEQNETDKIAEDAAVIEGTTGQKDGDEEEDSSSEDEPTVTIGKIVKQPDILRPPPPVHRSAPTSGLKEDDFNSAGKINGVPATEFSLAEMEEKPWRKPGADLSDYFNYGFTEDTWLLYCERQRKIRTNESGIGLSGLGINVAKTMLGSSNISVPVINNDNKYGSGRPKPRYEDESIASMDNFHNTIQVMTADRRSYSNKVLTGPGYDEMDNNFNPNEPPPPTYPDGGEFFGAPPAPFFSQPPPPWGEGPLPPTAIPPPGWTPGAPALDMPPSGPPPNLPPPQSYFEEEEQRRAGRDRSKLRSPPREEKERESRHHGSRRRSRSRSRSRPRHNRKRSKSRERSRSKSKSPSHRHKRKRSKRDRED